MTQLFTTLADITLGTPIAVLMLAMGFGFVIFVHELGHFLAAKAVGIKCTQFAIGFGHALLCYRKGIGLKVGTTEPQVFARVAAHLKGNGIEPGANGYSTQQIDAAMRAQKIGETEYRLNWCPLGGYVKMLGQEDVGDQSITQKDDPGSFANKSVGARFIVISAGVVMNAIFAVVFFIVAFMAGVEFPPAIIGDVAPGLPAATTPAEGNPGIVGLQPGDVVLTVNGEKPMDFIDISMAAALAKHGEKVTLVVERPAGFGVEGGRYTFHIEPTDGGGSLRKIGVGQPSDTRLMATGGEQAWLIQQKLDQAGLQPGMRLVGIGGSPIHGYHDLNRAIYRSPNATLTLTFEDEQSRVERGYPIHTGLMFDEQLGHHHLLGLVPMTRVDAILPGSPADGKMQIGDLLLRVEETDLPSIASTIEIIQKAEGEVRFTMLRGGEETRLSIQPDRGNKIGVSFAYATDTNLISRVMPASPFEPLELIAPARITSVGGVEVHSFTDLRRTLMGAPGAVEIAYSLPHAGDSQRQERRAITLGEKDHQELASLEWGIELPLFQDLLTIQKAQSMGEALSMGTHKSWVMMIQTYQTLRALIQQTVSVKELRGPVGIAHVGTQITKRGWTYLMFFLGIISVNLAVLNFLPFPILDGGIAVLLLYEKLRGKPAPVSVQNSLTIVGLVLLLTLVLFVTYNDITRLVTGT